jgi:hypothetical protein
MYMMRTKNTGSSSKTLQLPIQGINSVAAYTVLRRTELSGFFVWSDAMWLLLVSAGNLKYSTFKNNLHTKYKHKEIKCAASAGCRKELQTLFSIPGLPGVKNIWNLKGIASTCSNTWWITFMQYRLLTLILWADSAFSDTSYVYEHEIEEWISTQK